MTKTVQMQVTLAHPRASVWEKLTQTEALNAWFAEQSHIALPQQRYDFWGRFTPGTPSQAEGQRPILEQSDRHLAYQWTPSQDSKRIYYRLQDHPQGSVFIVQQQDLPENTEGFTAFEEEDFWFLSLENLRRYLDGKPVMRCDFSNPMQGDIHHEISVEGSAEAVYQTLIRPDQLERWIASKAEVEAKPSGNMSIGWDGMGFKLLELETNHKVSWEWKEGDKTTISTWTLSESNGRTRITFVHSGFAPTDPTEGLQAGWFNYLYRIKNIVEYGPSYVPPILQIAPNMAWIYAKSITERQSELVI
jgi:uncharacterized protein YndB with AHSA1/START domain